MPSNTPFRFRCTRSRWPLLIGLTWTMMAPQGAWSEEAAKAKTGADFRRALGDSVGVNWSELSLRDAMRSLSHTQQICIFVDRRVDADQPVQFQAKGEPLEQLLARFAQERALGVSVVGSVIYLGPREATKSLATLAALKRQEASALPTKAKAAWLKSAPLNWPALTQPQELVEQLVAACGSTLANPEALPHDLWNAGNLPALPACDRLTLLLAGFDLTFELEKSGAEVQLTTAPQSPTYSASYTARGDAAKTMAEIQRLFSDVEVRRQGTQLQIGGRYEDHEQIERLLRGETVRSKKTTVGEKRYTVNVERQPAGAVLKRIATDTNRQLKYPPEVVAKLNQPVTFKVDNVPLEELLKATLGTLGLSWKLDDDTLEVLRPE